MDSEKTCATCAHYAGLPKECRAKAPTAVMVQGPQGPTAIGFFPPTKPENWCGEWRAEADLLAPNAKSNLLGAH